MRESAAASGQLGFSLLPLPRGAPPMKAHTASPPTGCRAAQANGLEEAHERIERKLPRGQVTFAGYEGQRVCEEPL